ncbi:MAG TPA: transglycosylase SLT domain-containing protein [Deltaproteobacteria bacterium]|nr:transglycosylase SLT domain-containing protein [Deltaproteobacteria bacterium]
MKYLASLVLVLLFTGSGVHGETLELSRIPSLISSTRIKAPLDFCKETVPLGNQEIRERMEKELLLTLWDRPQVILWLKRSRRHLPFIENMLAKHHLPDDLKYISVIESALRPHVGSPKGALGFWQFMPSTGRKYGLTVNREIDERRTLFAATRSAIEYLKVLYEKFGSWTLAAAAFNMGEQGLEAEILSQATDNYYDLYIPLETQRYMFRILSAKLILSSPQKYGFNLKPEDYYPPLQYDLIEFYIDQQTPIQLIARAAKTTFKTIKDLNPEIRGYHIEEGNHNLLIPKGSNKGFEKRLNALRKQWQSNEQKKVHVVREGENLSTIAEQYNVPLPALLIWNRLNPSKPIQPGNRLIIAPPIK